MEKIKKLRLNNTRSFKHRLKFLGVFLFFLVLSCCIGDHFFPLNLQRYRDTSIVIEANGVPIHIFYTKDDKWRVRTTVEDVSPLYLKTLIAREDRFFKYHPGINPFAFGRAIFQWIKNGQIISGGSTLSMQTARLLEPRARRISSKLIECFRAMQLEWHFSKKEILTIYLTLAPFGGNLEGVNAASMAYFNKKPHNLTAAEISLLVALVQSPTQLRPEKHPNNAIKARHTILQFMQKKQFITPELSQLNHLAPLPCAKIKPPREIPHLALRLKNEFPNQKKITTFIDLSLQKQVEQCLVQFNSFLPKTANTAILIIDHVNNKPLVYLGSRDFLDKERHGFVDYIQAYRSPGSTLKTFIYGLAFDYGIANPESYILDDYHRFGTYAPRNFDKDIHGVVKVKDALATSLNIPAVSLLNQIGVLRFLGILKEAGVQPQFPKGFESPSLPVALGGLGMTLEQLVALYGALGRHGQYSAIFYSEKPTDHFYQLISPRATTQITEILTRNIDEDRKIAFKTGTSYGHRDAIVIGYDKQYVVGIWVGIANGSTMGDVTGTHVVPLLQKIFKILPLPKPSLEKNNEPIFELQDFSIVSLQRANLKEMPSLLFPINNTIIELNENSSHIPLTVTGGKRPYLWLIDGRPLTTQCWQKKYFWTPTQSGYHSITVVDANGVSASADIEIQFS